MNPSSIHSTQVLPNPDKSIVGAANIPEAIGSGARTPSVLLPPPPIPPQPECVPGYHWDSSQQECLTN